MRTLRCSLLVLAATLLGACTAFPYSESGRRESQQLAQAQFEAAEARIDKEHISTIFAGYALFAGLKAFEGDLELFEGVVDRFAPANVKLEFSNVRMGSRPLRPFATEFDLGRSAGMLASLAERIRAREGTPPLLVLLLTSHGNTGYLVLDARHEPKRLPDQELVKMLKPLEAYPTLLIISACHSGSLIPALQHENRIIMTAAAADRTSFGCSTASRNTWFVGALQESLRDTSSVRSWFDRTRTAITARETREGLQPSNPQLWIGAAMQEWEKKKLSVLASLSKRKEAARQAQMEAASKAAAAAQIAANPAEAPAAP